MANHMTSTPESGLRQVNVRYKVDNPAFADLEVLRALIPFKALNKVMAEAILIGARKMLEDMQSSPTGQISLTLVASPTAVRRKTKEPSTPVILRQPDEFESRHSNVQQKAAIVEMVKEPLAQAVPQQEAAVIKAAVAPSPVAPALPVATVVAPKATAGAGVFTATHVASVVQAPDGSAQTGFSEQSRKFMDNF